MLDAQDPEELVCWGQGLWYGKTLLGVLLSLTHARVCALYHQKCVCVCVHIEKIKSGRIFLQKDNVVYRYGRPMEQLHVLSRARAPVAFSSLGLDV